MRLMLARDPFNQTARVPNLFTAPEDLFNLNWDETQLDMYEEEDKVIVKLKAPGFDEKNIDISIEDNTLTISGTSEVKEEEEDKKKKYYRREIRSESFARSVNLPTRVMSDQAEAHFKNGILELVLPKAEEVKPKKINVTVN